MIYGVRSGILTHSHIHGLSHREGTRSHYFTKIYLNKSLVSSALFIVTARLSCPSNATVVIMKRYYRVYFAAGISAT